MPGHPYGFQPLPPGGPGGQGPLARRRGRFLLFGGIGALVVALLAGLLIWNSVLGPEKTEAERDLKPFRQAVAALADAPGLRYQDSATGPTKRDVTVTASGSRFGTTGSGDTELAREILDIGGRAFTRQKDPAPGTGSDARASGTWTVAQENDDETQELVERRPSPALLAIQLSKSLDRLENTPAPDEPAEPPTVNGTPALVADTSMGRLLVTDKKPHRVLRLEPYGSSPSSGPSDGRARAVSARSAAPTPAQEQAQAQVQEQAQVRASFGDEDPSETPEVTEGPLDGSDSGGLDLAPITGDAVDPMFDTLEKQAKELNGATDSGISLALSGSGTVKCGSGGCTARNSFAGRITTDARSRLVGGKVTAVMTASFSIDGRSAGRCTSPQRSFAVTGTGVSGSLSCSNPGAGPTFASIESRKKAEARARSRASGGRPVQYRIPYRADTLITARALATTEVKKLVDKVRQERDGADCPVSRSASGVAHRAPGVPGAPGVPDVSSASDVSGVSDVSGIPGRSVRGGFLKAWYIAAFTRRDRPARPVALPVGDENCVNWSSRSVKTFGHTFKTHGAGAKNTKALTDRARSTGNQQGQWLDNEAAAQFLRSVHVPGSGPRTVRIPDGLGQVIMPDGTVSPARAATLVPGPGGFYRTAYPVVDLE
ncbi:hypothetical protein [Streptomyces sp. NPDC057496]|uniref:hypothetical protein n=1 Tax=Streptomyces sp. NPDC057496 TaxID=3346149 RepID=UPI00368E502F